jgi:hypothetical protein
MFESTRQYSEETCPPQCHSVYHKARMTWPGIEPWQPGSKAGD